MRIGPYYITRNNPRELLLTIAELKDKIYALENPAEQLLRIYRFLDKFDEMVEKLDKYEKIFRSLKDKEESMTQEVRHFEEKLRHMDKSDFYYSSYLKRVHALNAKREIIKDILKGGSISDE